MTERVRDTASGALAIELVRTLAVSGSEWDQITFRDDLEKLIDDHEAAGAPRGRLIRQCEKAYEEGRCEHLRKSWVTRWTTAPADYDWRGVRTVAEHGEWKGKTLREILMDPREMNQQIDRYASGLHGCWERDPRIEEAELAARLAAEREKVRQRKLKAEEGRLWLEALSDQDLEQAADGQYDAKLDEYGIGYVTVGDERRRRSALRENQERSAAWKRLRPLIPDGCTLVDDGTPGERGRFGWVPGRDPAVYYNVHVSEVAQDPERSEVRCSARIRPTMGTLADIGGEIERGVLRVAKDGEVPPEKVLRRFGQERLKDLKAYDVEGRRVWVGRVLFTWDVMVLHDNGRKAGPRIERIARDLFFS